MPMLSVNASLSAQGTILLTLCNLHPRQAITLPCQFEGRIVKQVSGKILQAQTLQSHNTFENPQQVVPCAFTGFYQSEQSTLMVDLPAASIVALSIEE